MRARGGARVGPPPQLPEWLTTFTLADWYDPHELVPLVERVDVGEVPWRCLQAYERWRNAGREWLAEVGYDASATGWRRVVDPAQWGASPHALAREVRHAA